jgi:hypothetical protein
MERNRFFWDSRLAVWFENRVENLAEWINMKRYPMTQYGEGWATANTEIMYKDPYQYTNDMDNKDYKDLIAMSKPLEKKPPVQLAEKVDVVKVKPAKKIAGKRSTIKKI